MAGWFAQTLVALVLLGSSAHADTAAALLARGAALQDAGEWLDARAIYDRLERISGQEGRAVYLQAWAASHAGAYEDALALAARAAKLNSPYSHQARLLYADLLARTGETRRAKDVYIALHTLAIGDQRAIVDARLAALNKLLGLPARDGLPAATSSARSQPLPSPLPAATADGAALYQQARDAFAAHDLQRAQSLAMRAAQQPGAHAFPSKVLYADTLYGLGEYKRAKILFIALRQRASAADARVLATKIAACNRRLALPASDGLP